MVNGADTVFVLFSAALVMLMTPGLALFYGGMVRRKNILSVLMQCFAALCLLSVWWMLFGYSLAFGPSAGFWGGLQWLGLNGVGSQPFADYSSTIPHTAFMIFQAMFAIITPALIAGAFAERIKFSAFLVFTILWSTFVYAPLCHWVWGSGGWLKAMGVLDFAGGIVVHTSAGIAALLTAIFIGKRKELEHTPAPHNLPFVVLGTGLLWFGWFGFNAGSALAANGIAVNAFVTTNASAAAAGISWAILEWVRNGKPTVFGIVTGSIAGLATITPCAGYVSPMSALVIGFCASVVCFIGVAILKPKFNYDDSLDAFGVHGIGGILGTLAVGLFASKAVNPAGADGLFYGNIKQLFIQGFGILVATAYTVVVTTLVYKFVDIFLGMRVKETEELMGLDITQHRERAYTVLE
ncbi:MAG: ammonium transporter [Candidatus Omnitrophica bacterium]|nr:ammonium transporter [Candidatus Omnitrophota bacterium]